MSGTYRIQIDIREQFFKLGKGGVFRQREEDFVNLRQRNIQVFSGNVAQMFQNRSILREQLFDQLEADFIAGDAVIELIFGIGAFAGFDAGVADSSCVGVLPFGFVWLVPFVSPIAYS